MSFLERLDCSQALGGRNGKETRVVDVKQYSNLFYLFTYLLFIYLFIYLFICLFIHSFIQSLIN